MLKYSGLVDPVGLSALRKEKRPYLIERFMLKPSINILVGHSGQGKSALCMQMGMCIAGGERFFGHIINEPGPVIYCDAESTPDMMGEMVEGLSYHIGYGHTPPEHFHIWNPNWNVEKNAVVIPQNKITLYKYVKAIKPKLVIIDSLRNFYPLAISKQEKASEMIKEMRKLGGETGTSFLLVHHLRKTDKEERRAGERASVRQNVNLWLEEASGTLALINNTDLRLGWEPDEKDPDNFWLGGFLRVAGTIGPFRLDRIYDDNGDPSGYKPCQVVQQLSRVERDIYAQLPFDTFYFTYITRDLGRKQGTTARFIRKALDLGLIRVVGKEQPYNGGRPRKLYQKTSPDEVVEDDS
ncbi:MAG: AAA family ATPase [Candidatus Thorarchaeota archaeon]